MTITLGRKPPKNASTGKIKEKKVARWLEHNGWWLEYSGGRGPADIIAKKGSTKWFIQVKYTRSTEMDTSRFGKEAEPLIDLAETEHGTAVLCMVIQNQVYFLSAKRGRTLAEGYLD